MLMEYTDIKNSGYAFGVLEWIIIWILKVYYIW